MSNACKPPVIPCVYKPLHRTPWNDYMNLRELPCLPGNQRCAEMVEVLRKPFHIRLPYKQTTARSALPLLPPSLAPVALSTRQPE